MQRLYFAAAILLCAGSLVLGADATWVGDMSTEIWDPNNWTSSEPNGVLTIGAGNPYDPIWRVVFPFASDHRVSRLNTTTEADLTILGGDNYVWSSDYLNGQVRIMGGLLSIRGNAYVGRDGPATLTVNGGSFSYKYTLYLGYGTGGDATLNVFFGDVYFTGRPVIGSNGGAGRIYIREGGSCYCGGDETVWFQGLVDDGIITTDIGLAVVVEYQSGSARTRISAQRVVGASLPVPWDETEDIGITSLSWKVGTLATSSQVYLGTDAAAVENATTGSTGIYLGSTTGNTMAIPYPVIAGTTYYWRVDTAKTTGSVKGDVWSFKAIAAIPPRRMEKLNRGVIAVRSGSSNYIGWRLMGTDPQSIAFNVYRGTTKVNPSPITDSTNYLDAGGTTSDVYSIRAVINGQEQETTATVPVLNGSYYSIPVQQVPGDTNWTYATNDGATGDLDGDGGYELVVKRLSTEYSETPMIEAYRLDGTFMWRISLGPNYLHWPEINPIVYDLDGDGRAEVILRTADGMTDGTGVYTGDTDGDGMIDYRPLSPTGQFITNGPEYFSIFDGMTGREMVKEPYIARGLVTQWGDNYGHRAEKFHMAIAYLDGQKPSLVICRGIYALTKLEGWNYRNGRLYKLWHFTSEDWPGYAGQGNHNLSVGDVDDDGKDEIVYGSMTVNHDGKGLYTTGLGHGDAMHLSDMDPDRPGLEVWGCLEGGTGAAYRDAGTGEVLIRYTAGSDQGRACAGDIDPRYRGYEMWGGTGCPLYSCDGTVIRSTSPSVMNFMIYWDGDLLRELLDHNWIEALRTGTGRIDKWNYTTSTLTTLLTATGAYSCNDTKGTPTLQADILGDWREEAIWRSADNRYIRIYTTTIPTQHRIYTLMHDPQYRLAIAWQCCAYNQPPHPGFFLGDGMAAAPTPHITLVDAACSPQPSADFNADCKVNFIDFAHLADAYASNNLGSEANLNRDDHIDFRDMALLGNEWLDCGRASEEECQW